MSHPIDSISFARLLGVMVHRWQLAHPACHSFEVHWIVHVPLIGRISSSTNVWVDCLATYDTWNRRLSHANGIRSVIQVLAEDCHRA